MMDGLMEPPRQPSDLTLTCCDCGADFTFTAGEQAYFTSKALSPPKRCGPCRKRRRSTLVPDLAVRHR